MAIETKQKSVKTAAYSGGIMNKMRDKMPLIIIFLIVAFLITIIFEWGMNYLGLQQDNSVFAKVNGEEISYQEYEQAVQQQLDQMRMQNGGKDVDDATVQQIREQVWNQLVTQILIKQQIEKYNISVSDSEVLDWIYNSPETLPDPIKRNFVDSTGVFNTAVYQQALTAKDPQIVMFWSQVEQYLRETLLQKKIQDVITSGVIVTEGDVLQKYKDDNIFADFDYVSVDLNRITDTTVNNVSDDDLKKYYEEHKNEFKQEEGVKFKYVVFSDAPTMDDSNATKKQLSVLIDDLKSASSEDSSLIKLVNDNSSSEYKDEFQKPNALGTDAVNFLFRAKPGDVSEVILDKDGYKIIRLLETKDGAETFVNASHILVNFGTDTAAAKTKAEDILRRVKAGEDINKLAEELSEDPTAKQNRGDLGWFTKGAMVKEFEDASFNAKIGDVVGPVKTQYGYHIIKVFGKDNKEFKVAEIKKNVTAGGRTKELARKKAEDFYKQISEGEKNIDSLAKELNLQVNSTPAVVKDGTIPGAGQNKNLIDLGFDKKINTALEPVKITGGYGVYMITEKVQEGFLNFDSVKTTRVKPKVITEKKFEKLKVIADDLKAKIQNGDLNSLKSVDTNYAVQKVDSFSVGKPDPAIGQNNYALNFAIFNNLKIGEISEPIKGSKGYYIIKLNSISPFNEQDYLAKANEIRQSLLNSKKQSVVQDWLTDLKNNADIIDNRDKFII